MERLTDSKVAAELKSNYEALQRVGIEPSMIDLRYVRLAELEEVYPKLVGGIVLCKELLRLAMADLYNAEDCDSCIYAYSPTGLCPANSENGECEFKWKHHDEAMQLLGEEE